MSVRNLLLSIQRSFYEKLKEHTRSYLGELSQEIKSYSLEHQKELTTYSSLSQKEELIREVLKHNIILCGDYHTLAQAQRTLLRLMRDTVSQLKFKKKSLALGLELLQSKNSVMAAKFLSGEWNEAKFLREIGYEKEWGFPWEHYLPLFDFAKQNDLALFGINTSRAPNRDSLRTRDRHAAKEIVRQFSKNPNSVIFVLVGDLHLAASHLPFEIKKELKAKNIKASLLTVHQNIESLYWKLVQKGLEQKAEVIKLKSNEYCIFNTPPWIKLQTHLQWMELMTTENSPSVVHSQEILAGLWEHIDYFEEIHAFSQSIQAFLGLKLEKESNFTVCSTTHDFRKRIQSLPSSEKKVLMACAKGLSSFYSAKTQTILIKTSKLNHLANQAGLYLHSRVSGLNQSFIHPKNDFFLFVWHEAFGFMGSKILNPKRKCNGPEDLKRIAKSEDLEKATIAKAALELIQSFPESDPLSRRGAIYTHLFHYKVAKVLGQNLGGALYNGLMKRTLTPLEIKKLWSEPLSSQPSEKVKAHYYKWIKRLGKEGLITATKSRTL